MVLRQLKSATPAASEGAPQMVADSIDFTRIDAIMDRFLQSKDGPLGLVYGVLHGGRLLHSRGLGVRSVGEATPTTRSIFRIASVSKSFTAAAILLLRDRGSLSLDDPVSDYLPLRLTGTEHLTGLVTLRTCLTMSAGFPTDDPWADRQEAMSRDNFDTLLTRLRVVRPPGAAFEYSNLGYAILGRVIELVAAQPFQQFVTSEFLRPLGLDHTTYDYREVPSEDLAIGYRKRKDSWIEQPFSEPGSFSAMAGLLSSVDDLSKWLAWLQAPHEGSNSPEASPLLPSSRLEMQQPHNAIPPEVHLGPHGEFNALQTQGFAWGCSSYGMGLFVEEDLRWGRMIHHIGGYPGYSAHLRWHPASGFGLVALTNRRYSPVWVAGAEALKAVLASVGAPSESITPWAETVAAATQIRQILTLENVEDVENSFSAGTTVQGADSPAMSPNVTDDVPASERAAEVLAIRQTVGPTTSLLQESVTSDSPAHLRWWQAADRGFIEGEVRLTPTDPPEIQTVTLRSLPRPAPWIAAVADAVATWINDPGRSWPDELTKAAFAETEERRSMLRTAKTQFGTVRVCWPVKGDSSVHLTLLLRGDEGDALLELRGSGHSQALDSLSLEPAPKSSTRNGKVDLTAAP
jgi:CubicO group peptidase (beta-lactamase class C family)